MIDFLLGLALGATIASFAILHFKGETPAKAISDLSSIEQRITNAMSQAFKDAFAAFQAATEADKARAVADAVAAAQAAQSDALAAAHADGVQAESDEDVAIVQAAMPAA